MAQNTFFNVGADKSSPSGGGGGDNNLHHGCSGGASASGDFTISFDNTVVTSLNLFDSLVRAVRLRAQAGGLK